MHTPEQLEHLGIEQLRALVRKYEYALGIFANESHWGQTGNFGKKLDNRWLVTKEGFQLAQAALLGERSDIEEAIVGSPADPIVKRIAELTQARQDAIATQAGEAWKPQWYLGQLEQSPGYDQLNLEHWQLVAKALGHKGGWAESQFSMYGGASVAA